MLEDYLTAARTSRWAWGRADCLHFTLGWLAAATGRDLRPALPVYGSYEEGRRALGAIWPDYAAMLDELTARAGWARREGVPRAGDVALLRAPGGETAALRVGPGYAMQGQSGVVWAPPSVNIEPLAHWGPL